MSIVLECGTCKKKLKAPEKPAGKKVRCKCGSALVIPEVVPQELDLASADLTGLLDGEAPLESACPSCLAPMNSSAVICTACGLNRKTGRKLSSTVVDDGPAPSSEPSAEAPAKSTKKKDATPERVAVVFKLLKVVFILAAIGGVGLAAYYIKEGFSFNPHQQAKDAVARISPQMTIEQVVTAMKGKPQEVWALQDPPPGSDKMPIDMRIGYAENFLKHHGPKKLQYGFRFVYIFSLRDQVIVGFTPDGLAERAELFDPMKALGM